MKLVIISGAEATCKSAIAEDIAKTLGCAHYSKDSIKEALFDKEKHSTWDFKWYEAAAKQALFKEIQSSCIENGMDCIVESNFIGKDKEVLSNIIPTDTQIIEIHCYASGLTSFRRAVKRNESKKRHPGHHDRRWYPKIFLQAIAHALGISIGAHKQVALSDNVLDVDTTNYPDIGYDSIMEFINARKSSKLVH